VAQSDEVGNGPCEASPELKVFQKEDGNQCCPNLGLAHWGGPDKRLYLEVLLDGLEEAFSLPAVLVNGGDGGEYEGEVDSKRGAAFLHSFVPHLDFSNGIWVFLL